MELREILDNLELSLNGEIGKLYTLGTQAKEEARKNKDLPNKKLQQLYVEMADIVKGFGPVEYLVRQSNPHLNELFDKLLVADWKKDLKDMVENTNNNINYSEPGGKGKLEVLPHTYTLADAFKNLL